MKKKTISLFLCIVLLVSTVFSGCGNSEEKKEPSKKNEDGTYSEFISIDVFDALANYEGVQSGWFQKVVKDKFNMELNIIAPNVSGGGDYLRY